MATAFAPAPAPLLGLRPTRGYTRPRFTANEFLRIGESGGWANHRLELVSGELTEMPMPGVLHARLQALIVALLASAAPSGRVAVGALTIRLSADTVREFDAGLIAVDAPELSYIEPGAVGLAVEIAVTTLAVDLDVKALEYSSAGIPAYWVIDANAEVVHAMGAPGPDGYARRAVVRFAEPLEVPGGGAIVIGDGHRPR